jgi:hypothetical protein
MLQVQCTLELAVKDALWLRYSRSSDGTEGVWEHDLSMRDSESTCPRFPPRAPLKAR